MSFGRKIVILFIAICSLDALAQHREGGGYPFEIPRFRPILTERIAQTNFKISDLNDEAQMHVNLAVEAMHGFWIFQAERHLREVMQSYPLHPMPFALAAFAHTIFGSGDYERGLAYFQQAQQLYQFSQAKLSRREQYWFMSIKALYDAEIPQAVLRQKAHLQYLEKIVDEFPDDIEAKAFLALATWLYRILDETVPPQERGILTAKADLLIDEVLRHAPQHPVHHYKIHLWNNGNEEFNALDSARASGPAQSHIAHLWHMPAHIFTRTNDFYYAMRHVDVAHRVDNAQLARNQLMPANVHNYYHNFRDFGLNLGANWGQWTEVLNRSIAMLEFGRLPHYGSRIGHAYLAVRVMHHLEKYEAWQKFQELHGRGIFDGLDTGNAVFDSEFKAKQLRLRLRSLLSVQAQDGDHLDEARALLADLETLKNRAALAGAPNLAELSNIFEDSRLWFEVSIRRSEDTVPRYFIEKLLQLEVTPKTQLFLLAEQLGHLSLVQSMAQELATGNGLSTVTDQLNLLSFFASIENSASTEVKSKLFTAAAANIQTPVRLEDFMSLKIATDHPRLLTEVLEAAELRNKTERAHPAGAFGYIDRLNMEEMGPEHPVRRRLKDYQGANEQASEAFASPERGRYKLLIYSLGPACLACNQQLQKFIAEKTKLESLQIEPVVMTATGENIAGLTTIPDADHQIHRQFDVWDQFGEEPLHGVFLLDSQRNLIWHSVSEHAIDDVDFLLVEFGRLITLTQSILE